MAEETLRVVIQDDASVPAALAADALDRLDKAMSALDGRALDMPAAPINAAAAALARLRTTAAGAGSAAAAALSGILDKATEAAAPVRKLASVFELVKQRADAARRAEAAAFAEAEKGASRIPTELQAASAPKQLGGFGQLVGIVGKLFGNRAAGGLVEGASALSRASDKLGPLGPVLAKGGGLLAVGAVAVAAAAAAIVVAAGLLAAKLLYAGSELAVKMTSAKEAFVGPLSKVLKDAGAAKDAYAAAIRVAVDLSLDKDETLKKARTLAGVGFRGAEIEVVLRAVADVREGIGDEQAGAFQKVFEKLKSGKAFSQETINGLVEAGINGDLVIAKLAKQLGVSVDRVKEKIKAGQIEVGEGIKAILAAAKEQTGGAAAAAASTVPAMWGSLKTMLESLFDDVDLSPVKEALASLKKILDGPEGAELKAAVTRLFGTVFKVLLGAFKGPEGEARLVRFITGATAAMEGAATIMSVVAPVIVSAVDGLSKVFDRSGSSEGGSWLLSIISGMQTLSELAGGPRWGAFVDALRLLVPALFEVGSDMIAGLVNGITSGASGVVKALVDAVNSAIAAANSALGRHSPAKATIAMGVDTSKGLELGIGSRLGYVAAAGTSMAAAALGGIAANDNGAAAPVAPAGGAGGSGVTIVVHVTAGPGVTREQAREAGEAAGEGAYQAWRRNLSRYVRDEKKAAA